MSLAAIAVKNKRKKSKIIAAQVAMVNTNKVQLPQKLYYNYQFYNYQPDNSLLQDKGVPKANERVKILKLK